MTSPTSHTYLDYGQGKYLENPAFDNIGGTLKANCRRPNGAPAVTEKVGRGE